MKSPHSLKPCIAILGACLLVTCEKKQPASPDPEPRPTQIDPAPANGTPTNSGAPSSEATEPHAPGWISDVERRARLPPDEYRKQQEERRQKVEETIADVSDVPLPRETHDFGLSTCRLEPNLLKGFYQRLHDSIDFNDVEKWQLRLDGDSSGPLDFKADGVRFPENSKLIILQPRLTPTKYAAWEQVKYKFYFNFADGVLYAVTDPSDD